MHNAWIVWIVGLVTGFGWLAWSRYLHHKEAVALWERGGDYYATLEMRERWRIRWGILVGALIMAYGLASALGATILWPWVRGPEPRSDWIWVGVLYPLVGVIIITAHVIWSIRRRREAPPYAGAESKE